MTHRILIVDDERKIAQGLQAYLRQAGYETLTAYDGQVALDLARRAQPDLVLLDVMLPQVNGWDVCRRLRQTSTVPIIMLTALGDETDMVIGLELGADDYIEKPFSPREVVARVRALLRRVHGGLQSVGVVRSGPFAFDWDRRIVQRQGHILPILTPTEWELLATLVRNSGRPLSREQLLDALQSVAYIGDERTIDTHIKNLRRKIEPDPAHPRYVLTVFRVGYRFAGDEDDGVPGDH